jgi:cell pole-organizing protein PopZ
LSQDLLSEFAEDDPLNLEIPIVPDDVDGGSLQDAAVENVRADGDFEALMDDILVGDDALQPEIEAKLDAGEASEMAARDLPDIETSEDMDLVRSLMDDLTDEDVVEGATGSVDPVADDDFGMAEAEAGADSAIEADLDTLSSDDTDILDTILDMTLDDAIAEIPMDVPEVQAEIDDLPEPVPEPEIETPISADAAAEIEAVDLEDITDSAPSLADIAASAEADAQALSLETGATAAAIAASVGTGAASLTQSSDADVDMSALMDEAEAAASEAAAADAMESDTGPVEPAVQETIETPNVSEDTSEDTSEMETPMPRAVRSDAILDEVTETATATAFAELNQVVEEKAVYNERGPRIGDLVQEALKPMLKDWLDANLKGIVERAVAKEVKRISSGK